MNRAEIQERGRYKSVELSRPKPDDNWPYHGHPKQGNDPQYGTKSPKFERHIYIRRDQIFFDIDTQLGIIAEAKKNPNGTEDDTLTNATSKYQQMFFRWIDEHTGEAKTIMSAFVLEQFKEVSMNSIKDVEEVDITLLMPEWYDDTTFPQLTDAVHNYITNATLLDYCSRRFTSKDPVTIDIDNQKTEAQRKIKKLVNAAKPGRIHRIQKPF